MRIVFAIVLVFFATTASTQPITCRIVSKFNCSHEAGCAKEPTGVWNVIDITGETYSRCDNRGCDKYEAQLCAPASSSSSMFQSEA